MTDADAHLIPRAAAPWGQIIAAITPAALGAPTPCAEYDVRGLINHLLFWGPSLAGAACKQPVTPLARDEAEVDLTQGDASATLKGQLDRTVSAWSDPEAWEGATQLGAMDLPASLVGGMVLGELVVHGWDLARASGQHPVWDDQVLTYLFNEVAANAQQGREMGVYGPEVPVPASSPLLDRILGLAGRDPRWTPAEPLTNRTR